MGYICTHVGYPRGSACEFFQRDTTNVTPEVKQGTMGITTIREQHNIYNTSDDKNMHRDRSEQNGRVVQGVKSIRSYYMGIQYR